jgi:hypothetical protein
MFILVFFVFAKFDEAAKMIPCAKVAVAVQGHLISSQLFIFMVFLFLFVQLQFF